VTRNTDAARSRPRLGRLVAVNVLVLLALLALVEISARIAVYFLRGSATAGLAEQQLNLTYQPFVMFGPRWDRQLPPASPGTRTVMLVGGSTAANFPVEILERAFTRRAGQPVRVVNAAYGGYIARQEVIVASIWGVSVAPTLLVSLDGHNDLEHRLRVPEAGTFFLDPTYRLYLTRPFFSPIASLLLHSQAYNAVSRLVARRRLYDPETYDDAVPVFLRAQESLNVIARGLSAERLMVLQPFVAFRRQRAPEEAAFTAYAYREPTLKVLYDRAAAGLRNVAARDGVPFLDARFLYDDVDGAIFSDDVHFRDARGYEILADAIVNAAPAAVFTR
jgi:hypothetical protein